ncbi:hypothetical protein LRQ08_30030 (plasmid) [Rhodococcus qingshengii]|uniref:hypothetical protein n=1 Tax=Rhodococcus qingshengii TaxID=334542 RepID=UPI002111FE94|nr:hypothetical protein [Rhodococcus qingshengii]UUE28693.1 hypothetical protein LRQ08_30030 [Rhodococcus qingshengii]
MPGSAAMGALNSQPLIANATSVSSSNGSHALPSRWRRDGAIYQRAGLGNQVSLTSMTVIENDR